MCNVYLGYNRANINTYHVLTWFTIHSSQCGIYKLYKRCERKTCIWQVIKSWIHSNLELIIQTWASLNMCAWFLTYIWTPWTMRLDERSTSAQPSASSPLGLHTLFWVEVKIDFLRLPPLRHDGVHQWGDLSWFDVPQKLWCVQKWILSPVSVHYRNQRTEEHCDSSHVLSNLV